MFLKKDNVCLSEYLSIIWHSSSVYHFINDDTPNHFTPLGYRPVESYLEVSSCETTPCHQFYSSSVDFMILWKELLKTTLVLLFLLVLFKFFCGYVLNESLLYLLCFTAWFQLRQHLQTNEKNLISNFFRISNFIPEKDKQVHICTLPS